MVGQRIIRVAVNGYGVIGKRVAQAVAVQKDMAVAGVADVAHGPHARVEVGRDVVVGTVRSRKSSW